MNKIKLLQIFCLFLLGIIGYPYSILVAQSMPGDMISELSIDSCYQWAKKHYPYTRQLDIIEKTTNFNIHNASHGNMPQIKLSGQASYQSDVTQLPIEVPGFDVPVLDKDQYKLYLDAYQPITNFGLVKNQKKIQASLGEIDKVKLDIDFFQLKDRINQVFFGTLLIGEKITQFNIILSNIDTVIMGIEAGIQNGTATQADKKMLEVEKISILQQIQENRANQKAFLLMLSTMTGKEIDEETKLIRPMEEISNWELNRPELALFELQMNQMDYQKKIVSKKLVPDFGLFGQGGYGRPAINFLSNNFEFYYIAGIRLNWNLSGLYDFNSSKQILSLAKENVEAKKESFLLNNKLAQSQSNAEIQKFQEMVLSDHKIIEIRKELIQTAKVQLENGLINTIDYIRNLNELKKAQQTKLLHETQLLLAQYNFKNITGN